MLWTKPKIIQSALCRSRVSTLICVYLSQRCLCTIPATKFELLPALFQMTFLSSLFFRPTFATLDYVKKKKDSLMSSHFRSIAFVTFYLENMCSVLTSVPFCTSCSQQTVWNESIGTTMTFRWKYWGGILIFQFCVAVANTVLVGIEISIPVLCASPHAAGRDGWWCRYSCILWGLCSAIVFSPGLCKEDMGMH